MSSELLLFLHLTGAFLFVGGSVAAAVLRVGALRRKRPSEIALVLRAVRPAVPLIAVGLAFVITAGLVLARRLGYELTATWLVATFVLLGWIVLVGALAGGQDRATRELAERLAQEDDRPSPELSARLRDPLNLGLNASLLLATVAIVALMVWKP
jgi:uncharacterized membrane protein